MVPIRPIENQDTSHNIEQDPQLLIQDSSTLSTLLTLYHNHQYRKIMIHHPYLSLIHVLLPLYLNSQVPSITKLMVL